MKNARTHTATSPKLGNVTTTSRQRASERDRRRNARRAARERAEAERERKEIRRELHAAGLL
jgi:hypothetical protein